jgi:hypothetical protein
MVPRAVPAPPLRTLIRRARQQAADAGVLHARLARAEIRADAREVVRGAVAALLAVTAARIALGFFSAALAALLAGPLGVAAATAIVGGGYALVAGVVVGLAGRWLAPRHKLEHVRAEIAGDRSWVRRLRGRAPAPAAARRP